MLVRVTLKSLAEIRSGHTFRGKVVEDPQGDVGFAQIKDIRGQTVLNSAALPRTHWTSAGKPPLLRAGDIVIPARGDFHHAAIADGEIPAIATSQLFVLRLRGDAVSPEYLAWYLNRPPARNYFQTQSAGSSIPMLGKPALGELEIPLPAPETQRKIVALQRLWEREQQITARLLANREAMLAGIFGKLLEH